jgi:NADP-dependent 3-hydroxy acid dehydrogenase YdfG
MQVSGSITIITGASAGIGLATARLFAAQGARVALASRSAQTLKTLAGELPDSFAIPTDMRDGASIKQMVEAVHRHYGRIDLLINNAGQALYSPVEQVNLDDYRQIMELNVYGPLLAMQAVIPAMREQGGGMILNISSNVSKMYIPGLAAYASTKYALNALTLTARAELANDNIRVSVMHPGLTATDFGRNAISSQGRNPSGGPAGPRRPGMPTPDSPENVAAKILEAVQTEAAETSMHNLPPQA